MLLMVKTTVAQSPGEASAVHQEVFARIAHDYCYQFAGRKELLLERLRANRFTVFPQHDLTYSRDFAGVNYAVTLDDRRCTADVLLTSLGATGVPSLFSAKDIVSKLAQRLNTGVVKSETRTDEDSLGVPTKVLWVQFDDQGNQITLSYPQERSDTYYVMFDVYRLAD